MPSLEAWLRDAVADAERSDQKNVRPVLEALAASARQVRQGAWTADASTSDALSNVSIPTDARG
ncbi:MAG TPA: hypothetical protein VIY56_17515 [Vicinamibacterales bacterium]